MFILINSFSFKELGLSEHLIETSNILIISPSRVKISFPMISDKVIFMEEWSDDYLQQQCLKLNLVEKSSLFIANGEEKIVLAGLLNAQSGISESYFQAMSFIDKYLMRTLLTGVVQQPKFIKINTKKEVKNYFTENTAQQYILKPRAQSSANGLYIVSSSQEIDMLPENLNGYILEKFVDYDIMLTSDGIAQDGKIHTFAVHEYGEKLTESIVKCHYATVSTSHFYTTNPEVIEKVFKNTEKVLDKLMVYGHPIPFHMEWFYNNETGELTFCEGASRFGGAEIPKLIECAFDLNIKNLYWSMLLNKNINETERAGIIRIPRSYGATFLSYRREGVIEKLPKQQSTEWFDKYSCYVKVGDKVKTSSTATENIFIAVFKCKKSENISKGIEKCVRLLKDEVGIQKTETIQEEKV
ncbi:ATP-grasp domain-containing protein [Listeria kieliensis]|uniref:ATP-grasp domain-containing protein n=1 Tax=Listeria kieliensis TaxID=1621700 RepID=A0A3D8TRI3_9LIST|nr:ATP-grasp domain-containing protein [Listeria kieliensis]RDX01322.1 hypothetical protein UR08_10410 [Listeria kieliensis]